MNVMTASESVQPVSGGFRVDVSRGQRISRVSSEWFSRPNDERYLNLADLYEAVRGRAERAQTRTVERRAIKVEANRDNPERLALAVPGRDEPVAPTHWSFGQFGLAVLATSIAFMLWGRRLLSKQLAAKDAETRSPSAYDLIGFYGLADRWHRLRVSAGSPLINRSVIQMQHQYDRFGFILVGLEKHPRGKPQFLPALPETVFEANDAIFVIGDTEQARQLIETQQLVELPRLDERQRSEALQELGAAEVLLAPESKLIGKTLGELEFRSRYPTVLCRCERSAKRNHDDDL